MREFDFMWRDFANWVCGQLHIPYSRGQKKRVGDFILFCHLLRVVAFKKAIGVPTKLWLETDTTSSMSCLHPLHTVSILSVFISLSLCLYSLSPATLWRVWQNCIYFIEQQVGDHQGIINVLSHYPVSRASKPGTMIFICVLGICSLSIVSAG